MQNLLCPLLVYADWHATAFVECSIAPERPAEHDARPSCCSCVGYTPLTPGSHSIATAGVRDTSRFARSWLHSPERRGEGNAWTCSSLRPLRCTLSSLRWHLRTDGANLQMQEFAIAISLAHGLARVSSSRRFVNDGQPPCILVCNQAAHTAPGSQATCIGQVDLIFR